MDLIYRLDKESRTRRELPADADAARARLEEGNRQFARLLAGTTEEGPHVFAVTAAVDASLDPGAYPTGEFGMPPRALVDRVLLAIQDSAAAARARG